MEDDVRYRKLYQLKNLKLAWDRINTTTNNIFYKNYYRRLFSLYQINIDDNLKNLAHRLKEHTYHPSEALKFYKPKENGLLRPFTFIDVEDHIVYQAIANIVLLDFSEKRKELEHKYIFSNIICENPKEDIFLFEKWEKGYQEYKQNIKNNYSKGLLYTAHFDLASFYDTIDHHSLTSEIIHDNKTQFSTTLFDCLAKWSNCSTKALYRKIYHSLPQGPLASRIFAELFLHHLNKKFIESLIIYSRYVDDIVIQGKTEIEVRRNVAIIDQLCKEKGLVSQSSKFKIFKATSAEDAVGKNASIDYSIKCDISKSDELSLCHFDKAMEERDISLIRYILHSCQTSDVLVSSVLEHFEEFYDFSTDFCSYLRNFTSQHGKEYDKKFSALLLRSLIPYEYVKKDIWELMANVRFNGVANPFLAAFAQEEIESASVECRFGIYCYLAILNNNVYLGFLQNENSLLQLLQIKYISPEKILSSQFPLFIEQVRKRALNDLSPLLARHLEYLYHFGEINKEVYESLNFSPIKNLKIDSFNHYLKVDYRIDSDINWKKYLGKDYKQLNELMYYIHLYKKMDKTAWLNLIDVFCDLLLKKLIPHFENILPSKKGWPNITTSKKEKKQPKDHGSILQELSDKKLIPNIAASMRRIHERRCCTPFSHPKSVKTLQMSTFLRTQEQRTYFFVFKTILNELIQILEGI